MNFPCGYHLYLNLIKITDSTYKFPLTSLIFPLIFIGNNKNKTVRENQ